MESAWTIEIQNLQSRLKIEADALRSLARHVLISERKDGAEVSILLVDDATIHEINLRHLDHDWPTDVITFPLSDPEDPIVRGELVVSTDTACSTAQSAALDPWEELALYVTHGLLHLLGFDDRTEADALEMRRREREILVGFGLVSTFSLVDSRLVAGTDDDRAPNERRETARWSS